MKSIRLPETDLANLTFRPYQAKVQFLTAWLRPKLIEGSYEPLRRSVGEAANVGLPLIPDLPVTSLEQLEQLVVRECKGNVTYMAMNLPAVRAIRTFMADKNAEAEFLEELPLTLYPGMRYSFWAPMLIRYEGKARIVFLDLRRNGGLVAGLPVCFSLMHERFRVLDPSFSSVEFETWRFADSAERTINVIPESKSLIPLAEIIADVAETYKIMDMLRGQAGHRRTTDYGPLFG